MRVNDQITRIELRHEKHKGKDDVYLVHFASSKTIHVDEAVAKELSEDCVLQKTPWEKQLHVLSSDAQTHQKSIDLEWSSDFVGMVIAMPLVLLILRVAGIVVARTKSLNL